MRYLTGMMVLVLAAAGAAEAHPGHGSGGGAWTVQHYASEPLHLGALVALVALAAAALVWRWQDGRRARRTPARPAPRVL